MVYGHTVLLDNIDRDAIRHGSQGKPFLPMNSPQRIAHMSHGAAVAFVGPSRAPLRLHPRPTNGAVERVGVLSTSPTVRGNPAIVGLTALRMTEYCSKRTWCSASAVERSAQLLHPADPFDVLDASESGRA